MTATAPIENIAKLIQAFSVAPDLRASDEAATGPGDGAPVGLPARAASGSVGWLCVVGVVIALTSHASYLTTGAGRLPDAAGPGGIVVIALNRHCAHLPLRSTVIALNRAGVQLPLPGVMRYNSGGGALTLTGSSPTRPPEFCLDRRSRP